MTHVFDVIIRIDKLDTGLTKDEIRNRLSDYINRNMICDRSRIQIFGGEEE